MTTKLSVFVQDGNGTVYELVPIEGVYWDPEDSFGDSPGGHWYIRPGPLSPEHQPLFRLVLPTEESST